MALSLLLPKNIIILTFSMSLLASNLQLAFCCHFSIVGYSPEDLTSMDKLIKLFESWIMKHGKVYEDVEEKLQRFEIFKDNLKHMDGTNKKITNYWLGLNEFADLSHEEFKNKYLGLKPDLSKRIDSHEEFTYKDVDVLDLPMSGLEKGRTCHSCKEPRFMCCWAFSTAAAVDGMNQIVTGNLTSLSEQELIDCDKPYNNGCNEGLMDYAFAFIVSNGGLHKEENYPFLMEEGTCEMEKEEQEVVTISGYHDVPGNHEESLLKALAHQTLKCCS